MNGTVKRRTYTSPLRAEQARRTRYEVIKAAQALFIEHGYGPTTIEAIGMAAGVAADTVYHLFKTKRGLLKEVMDVSVGGDAREVAVLDREDPQAMRAETDQRKQVVMFAAGMSSQLERVRPLDDILRSAAAVDPAIARLREDLQLRQRRTGMTTVASWIAARGPLRAGLTVDEAAAIIWTSTSPEVHKMLRVDWDWSPQRYEAWLRDTLLYALLPAALPAGRIAGRPSATRPDTADRSGNLG